MANNEPREKDASAANKDAESTDVKSTVPRFLVPGGKREKIVLASYPRCGNSLLRGLLESVTGLVTGSDTKPNRTLSRSLTEFGLKGEGVVSDKAWVVKTHFPERAGWKTFTANRAIVLVRNPYDAIDSYFNMCLTNSHNSTLDESQYVRFADKWEGMTRHEIRIWSAFYDFWLRRGVPLFILRYEDLVSRRRETLRRLFCWMLRKESLAGTDVEARLDAICGEEVDAVQMGPYPPRRGGVGKSLKHYSEEQRRDMEATSGRALRCFGYHSSQGFPSSLAMPAEEKCRNGVKDRPDDPRVVTVNKPNVMLREDDDPYGRAMSGYRRGLTDAIHLDTGVKLDGEGRPITIKEEEGEEQGGGGDEGGGGGEGEVEAGGGGEKCGGAGGEGETQEQEQLPPSSGGDKP